VARKFVFVCVRATVVPGCLAPRATASLWAATALVPDSVGIDALDTALVGRSPAFGPNAGWVPLLKRQPLLATFASWRSARVPAAGAVARKFVFVRVRAALVLGGLAPRATARLWTVTALVPDSIWINALETTVAGRYPAFGLSADWVPLLKRQSLLATGASWRSTRVPTARAVARKFVFVCVRATLVPKGLAPRATARLWTATALVPNSIGIDALETAMVGRFPAFGLNADWVPLLKT